MGVLLPIAFRATPQLADRIDQMSERRPRPIVPSNPNGNISNPEPVWYPSV
jgi:hypothetical protein